MKNNDMEIIRNQQFEGERPLYRTADLRLENVRIGKGESALKECADIEAYRCEFDGKYPFWCVNRFKISDCVFRPGARAAIWYSQGMVMTDTLVEAPKMFREMDSIELRRVKLVDAQETMWHCRGIKIRDCELKNGDYVFMRSSDIDIDRYVQQGNYSFQYCKNVVIRNARLDTKDAFWNTENVTVYDSEIDGEYLGWYSRGLRLVRCKINGTQPLCYADGLVLEDCEMGPDADLAFEYSTLKASIKGRVVSVKNPTSGQIVADSIGDVIIDANQKQPADCVITTR